MPSSKKNLSQIHWPIIPPSQDELILKGNQAFQQLIDQKSKLESDSDEELPQRKFKRLQSRISIHEVPSVRNSDAEMDNFDIIMENNLIWSEEIEKNDPLFFQRLKDIQTPQYLWIGCSDSRVPANEVVGLKPGQLFVHRNIANQAPLSDNNAMAVIQYAVQVLKVKDIIVCGHYGCGGIKAAFKKEDHGSLESWLSFIRNIRARYRKEFSHDQKQNENLLVQLNVKHNVLNIARIPVVQKAWKQGHQLRIHGLVYQLENGILKDLKIGISSLQELQQEYKIY